MALTVDEIAEILNTMRVENEHNVENFEKVLTGINAKLEIMSEDSEATDLIKLYISELKKAVEDKHSTSVQKFNSLESALKNIISSQDSAAKTSELRDLFHVLGANFDRFSSEVANQKDVLQSLEDKLEIINSNSFNKDELSAFVADFSTNLSDMEIKVEASFDKIENVLSEVLGMLENFDASKQIDSLNEKLQSLSLDVNSIPSKISFASIEDKISYFQNLLDSLKILISETAAHNNSTIYDKFNNLEKALLNINTVEEFADFRQSLTELVQSVHGETLSLNSELAYGIKRIENIYDTVNAISFDDDLEKIDEKFNELKQLINLTSSDIAGDFENLQNTLSSIVTASDFTGFKSDLADFVKKIIDNSSALNSELSYSTERIENILTTLKSLDFRDDFENLVARINGIKETFEESTKVNYSNISQELSELSKRLDLSFENLDSKQQESFKEFKLELADSLSNLQKVVGTESQKTIYDLSTIANDISSNLNSLRTGISSDLQEDYGDFKASLNVVISDLQTVKDDILSQNLDSFELSFDKFTRLEDKLDEQLTNLYELNSAIAENEKIENSKLLEALDKSNLAISELISLINESSSSNIETVKGYIDEIAFNVNNLYNTFNASLDLNAEKIAAQTQNLSQDIKEFRDEFKQSVQINLENSSRIVDGVVSVSDKINGIQEVLKNSTNEKFDLLSNQLEELSQKLVADFQQQKEFLSNANENDNQKKFEILNNLSDEINDLKTIISSNTDAFKFVIQDNIEDIKAYIGEANNSIYESQMLSENKLSAKLEALDVLHQGFESLISNVNSGIENVLNNIATLDITDQNNIIKNEIEKLSTSSSLLLSGINDIILRNEEFAEIISGIKETVFKKEDVNSISDKLENLSEIIVTAKDLISSTHGELENSFITSFQKIEASISNVATEEDFSILKSELADLLQRILDNSSVLSTSAEIHSEKIEEILEKLSNIKIFDYSYDLEQISLKLSQLVELYENLSAKQFDILSEKIDEVKDIIVKNNNTENINSKFENFSQIMLSVKDLISDSFKINTDSIEKQFIKFEQTLDTIVTEEDFTIFRTDFSDFIQKILDNATVLNVNSEANKEHLIEIAEKIKTFDYTQDFENIFDKLDEVKTFLENNSKMNYDSIIEEINLLKEGIEKQIVNSEHSNQEGFNKLVDINSQLSDIALNVQQLQDFSAQRTVEIFDNISADLHTSFADLKESFDGTSREQIQNLINLIENVTNEISSAKNEFVLKYDNNYTGISDGFENIRLSIESLLGAFTSFRDLLKEDVSKNSNNVVEKMDEMTNKVEDFINEIHNATSTYADRIIDSVHEVSEKLEENSACLTNEIGENLSAFKEIFSSLSENLETMHTEFSQQLRENHDNHICELKNIAGNVSEFKLHIDDVAGSLKDYISELNLASKASKSLSDSKFAEKLLDMESAMLKASELYEQKMEILQGKLAEFAQIIEGSASDTEAKIAASGDEIAEVKTELTLLNDFIKAVKLSSDDKFTETVATIETGISDIINNISDVNSSLSGNIDDSIKANISQIENNLGNLIQQLQSENSNKLTEHIEDKLFELKQEVGLINTDIVSALQDKSESITSSIDELKVSLQDFSSFDFSNIISEVKAQLELSFMNFSVDINGELAANNESIIKLEQAYKETFNSITLIEECVSEKLQNSIELLKIAIESSSRDVKYLFEDKFEESLADLRSQLDIALSDTKTIDKIDNAKEELSVKLDSVLNEQTLLSSTAEKIEEKLDILVESSDAENILNSLNELELQSESRDTHLTEKVDIINAKLDTIADNSDLKDSLDNISDKLEDLANDKSLNDSLKILSEKVDILASDPAIEELHSNINSEFESLNSKIDIIASDSTIEELQNSISDAFEELNSKIDVIASDSSVEELHDKFDEFYETEDKVAEMLSALHEKVDVLAMDGSDFDLEEEIDDIKELIFEQRKYFEATSDEKAAAIDKYLRDVLLKLDNVDLDKNSEDIKESIMNALVSLFDQVSFVEETEEIKDFVEEKTEQINQSLIEVQNQLKQIASSNDDFDYSYTLQDVETDIAKLRIAINNMTGNDFGSLSDDIKKIVNSVEGLESTLTQDQVVDLKGDIEKLNEDILSISSRTNKLLLSSDESYKALNDGLNNFSSLVYKLEDRINYLDSTEISERLERKLDNIHSMSVASANADKVFHQVMMYLGEWIDTTTENISNITEKTSEIDNIKECLDELREAVPDKHSILDELENRFEEQELRIDRLEMKLDKILSTLEEKDDMVLNRKVDKIEKLLSRLGTNIEKLASYVDEE